MATHINKADFLGAWFSVALTEQVDATLAAHLGKGPRQEDLCFAYWRPSRGDHRYTAVLREPLLPRSGDRILQGNVAFSSQYAQRVLANVPGASGVALLHSHLGPGWQDMSEDDVVAERDRLAGAVAGQTGLPLIGLTRGTDGTWSARFWLREKRNTYDLQWARTVRVVGRRLRISHQPLEFAPPVNASQVATASVWGHRAQSDVVRTRVGIVGLGSVGSIVTEALGRMGVQNLTLIDFDAIERRNLDRTLGATEADVVAGLSKTQIAARNLALIHTAEHIEIKQVNESLLSPFGLAAVLDCDVLISCVDRPRPRFLLNAVAYSHLIPVIDGGIIARIKPDGTPLHIDWRIHTVGPGRPCLVCLDALRRSDVALDMEGELDDPDYIEGLSEEDRVRFERRNVFPFSLSVAAHEALQLVGLVTGMSRIGGVGPQAYHAYPGTMNIISTECVPNCEFAALTASAVDLSADLASVPLPESKKR